LHFSEAVQRLERSLREPLPGASAHARFAPRPRREWPSGFNPDDVRAAAALLLVFPIDDRAHILLTVRAETLGRHRGQVSLPGGVIEPGETFEQAALREAHEEVALPLEDVRVLGALTPLDIPVSGFRLHPIVATLDQRPTLSPAGGEVARIVEVDIDALGNPARSAEADWMRDGITLRVPLFRAGGAEIWGATAMVLSEFLSVLKGSG
jgi:8-oxo-dGTP pyrophosphatase MutT (NUDIX family)